MKQYTPDELGEILALHTKWRDGDSSGERANLRDADLRGADLRDADLRGADLRDAYLSGAYLSGADLRGADLRGAYLSGANLRGADLRGANLRGAYLRGADLSGANLRGADLRGAYLSGAYLRGAYLSGADLRGVKVKTLAVFTGLYKYIAMPVIAEDGTEYIRIGCHFRKAREWALNFWNNPSEFPNNGDIDSKDRWNAYQTCLRWLEDHRGNP